MFSISDTNWGKNNFDDLYFVKVTLKETSARKSWKSTCTIRQKLKNYKCSDKWGVLALDDHIGLVWLVNIKNKWKVSGFVEIPKFLDRKAAVELQ